MWSESHVVGPDPLVERRRTFRAQHLDEAVYHTFVQQAPVLGVHRCKEISRKVKTFGSLEDKTFLLSSSRRLEAILYPISLKKEIRY